MIHKLYPTFRWFGPSDPVTLSQIRQTGAKGIVTALHHIPHGEVWSKDEVVKRKEEVEAAGFDWAVVESITVHESVKTRTGDYKTYIEKYKTSIRNVAAAGIPVITYNFMPVNDWTRTSLDYRMPDGSLSLYFNWTDLAVFDIYLLKRKNAEGDYSPEVVKEAAARYKSYSQSELDHLAGIVMFGIPGEQKETIEGMLKKLETYKDIDHATLQSNLTDFLAEIAPVAQEAGVKLAIHPDDPPYPILGLPRVVSKMSDLIHIINKVNIEANGICFCTGSLGASKENDIPTILDALQNRIYFFHLRNVKKDEAGNFHEAAHLAGDTNMYEVVKSISAILQKRQQSIPFRPDHGHQMLDDLNKKSNPGYSLIGRMKGLVEIQALEMGIVGGE